MEDSLREPVELTAFELDAVTGGVSGLNLNISIIVNAGNGDANGVADGIANFIFGASGPVGIGNGNGNTNGNFSFG
jgi:hypothetical protein